MHPLRRTAVITLTALPLALGLTACSGLSAVPGLDLGRTAAPTATATVTAAPSPTPVAVVPVVNDLALGSAHHELQAGGMTVSVDYWSTLDMAAWTADAAKPISLAAKITGPNLGTGRKQQKAYISTFSVTSTATAADGSVSSPVTVTDTSRQTPGYLAMDPYAYSTSFVVPQVAAGVRSVQLLISYDVLQQSAPGAGDYSKQTATDTLTVAIAEDGTATVTPAAS